MRLITKFWYDLWNRFSEIRKEQKARKAFDLYIKQNPDKKVCFTCFGYCGQCGGSGHFKPLKDFKKSEEYKFGWPKLLNQY